MTRWIVAVVLVVIAAALLWPIAFVPEKAPTEEAPRDILGYRLEASRPLEVEVPAPIEALYITTWAVLEDSMCEPVDRYTYGVFATFYDENNHEIGSHDFDLISRRSCDGEQKTRLADSTDPVADHRTIVLRMPEILPKGGRMRLYARPGITKDVIVMIEARHRRDPYGQRVRELSYTPEDRKRIAGRIMSLGFADLPASARSEVAGAWSRRVDASGFDGRDYTLRRLILRDFTMPLPAVETPPLGFPIGERHFAALNLQGSVTLEIAAPSGTLVRLRDPRGPSTSIVLGESGKERITLPDAPLRTVVLEGEGTDVRVQTIVDDFSAALQQIGDVKRRPMPEGRVEVSPDLRLVKFAALDPQRPVVARIADTSLLRVEVRGVLEETDPAEEMKIPIEVRWGSSKTERLAEELILPRSRFERWGDGTDATDRARLLVRAPPSAGSALITGPTTARVVLKAYDGRVEDLLALPYRVQLQEDEIWRYPPFDLRRWVPVLPENHLELREDGRWFELREQVRIEKPGSGSGAPGARPERILIPEHDPVRRRYFAPGWLAPGAEMPPQTWSPVNGSRAITVASDGPSARRIRILYRVPETALGADWRLVLDGEPHPSEKLAVTSGVVDVSASPGRHVVSFEAPPNALFLVDCAPDGGGEVLRERTVFELTKKDPIELRFSQASRETLTVVLFVVTEGRAKPWSLRYTIDDGHPVPLIGRFFRVVTLPVGSLSGDGAQYPRGRLWETAAASISEARDAMSKAKIPLGDDLEAGRRKVRIELDADATGPVWISAVLFGQAGAGAPSGARVWVEEDQ